MQIRLARVCARAVSGAVGLALLAAATVDRATEPTTLGYVVTSIRTAAVETPYMEECPEGVAVGNDEIWWKSLSPRARDLLTDGGLKEPSARRIAATLRGPKGEDVCWNPAVVVDPPLRIARAKLGIGLNLDGTADGHGTATSCRHEKFRSADGLTAIDNQMARLVGCIHGWRANGYIEAVSDGERRDMSKGVLLIEIAGAADLRDAADVTVRLFRADDVMPKDATGQILPYASYAAMDHPRYGAALHGRIVDGELITDPADVRIPFYGNRVETEFKIRAMQLRLKLGDARAEGLMAGYHDLANWWDYVRKMGYLVETAQFSCPALYAAAHALADGYPDASGACTALSTGYALQAERAFIVHRPTAAARVDGILSGLAPSALPKRFGTRITAAGLSVVEENGRPLYANTVGCIDGCGPDFDPVMAPWIARPNLPWSTPARRDGLKQWAFDGKPLFTCRRDVKPDAVECAAAAWKPLAVKAATAVPAWVTYWNSELGPVLADPQGRTLYRFIGDLAAFKREICDDACLAALWRPVPAAADAQPVGDWRPSPDRDGATWTYRGRPVYTFAEDDGPGAIAGHRFGGASVSVQNWFTALRADAFFEPTAP
jgi:predicted lipoprotein with Yx(FWY)xxD motif